MALPFFTQFLRRRVSLVCVLKRCHPKHVLAAEVGIVNGFRERKNDQDLIRLHLSQAIYRLSRSQSLSSLFLYSSLNPISDLPTLRSSLVCHAFFPNHLLVSSGTPDNE